MNHLIMELYLPSNYFALFGVQIFSSAPRSKTPLSMASSGMLRREALEEPTFRRNLAPSLSG
jgi:hypothetical protein